MKMAAVESDLQEANISNRLTAIEAIILHLATKADVADLRADIEKAQSTLIKWFIGTWLASMTIIAAILGPLLVYILSRLP